MCSMGSLGKTKSMQTTWNQRTELHLHFLEEVPECDFLQLLQDKVDSTADEERFVLLQSLIQLKQVTRPAHTDIRTHIQVSRPAHTYIRTHIQVSRPAHTYIRIHIQVSRPAHTDIETYIQAKYLSPLPTANWAFPTKMVYLDYISL